MKEYAYDSIYMYSFCEIENECSANADCFDTVHSQGSKDHPTTLSDQGWTDISRSWDVLAQIGHNLNTDSEKG